MATNIQAGAASGSKITRMNAVDWIAMILLIVGGVNWALVGLFDFDLVAAIFGSMTTPSRIVYVLVGLAAVYSIYLCIKKMPRTPGSA